MPGLNRKGPQGHGAMTGKKQGLCKNTSNNDENGVFSRRKRPSSNNGNNAGRNRGSNGRGNCIWIQRTKF